MITRASDGIGRVVINVVRVGNAVVVDLASDEGTGDTVIDLATVTRENLADVVAGIERAPVRFQRPHARPVRPGRRTTIPADFPLDLALGEPRSKTARRRSTGLLPTSRASAVRPRAGRRWPCPAPTARTPTTSSATRSPRSRVTTDGAIHAYESVQDALDQMELLRSQILGCDRDSEGDGLSDRLWRTFSSDSGYDSVTFGYTYEVTENVGATAGQLYTVVRVGNAILAHRVGRRVQRRVPGGLRIGAGRSRQADRRGDVHLPRGRVLRAVQCGPRGSTSASSPPCSLPSP